MEQCPKCGTAYQHAGNSEDGYVRSICECEHAQKCFKCKRGQQQPVNQALLHLDFEVKSYACAKHGHLEAESFQTPTAPIGTKTRMKAEPAPAPMVEPVNRESRKDMEIVEHGYQVRSWSETKRALVEDMKDKTSRYHVVCTDASCNHKHLYSDRKLQVNDEKTFIKIVCPKCSSGSYRIL
jgi:hypothetical protein